MNRDPRFALSMDESAQRETPHIGIFWLVQTLKGETRLLAAGCPLDQAEPYGDCLTYGPGHYETWARWRRDRTVDHALRALVRSYEYEDWPRGRIVFDRSRDLFIPLVAWTSHLKSWRCALRWKETIRCVIA
jgi:hypothetical protein